MLTMDELSVAERDALRLAEQLRRDGDLWALLALLPPEDEGRSRMRAALSLLAECDPEALVDLAVTALVDPLGPGAA
jgi:hypothetical protein